jgi:hypothetical protein
MKAPRESEGIAGHPGASRSPRNQGVSAGRT